jgi:hypothetical protein
MVGIVHRSVGSEPPFGCSRTSEELPCHARTDSGGTHQENSFMDILWKACSDSSSGVAGLGWLGRKLVELAPSCIRNCQPTMP